jgi:PucR-like helix-turn-helix protein/diguanylate cyclase with GGDEF domain
MPQRLPERASEDLQACLRARAPELEEAILTRILDVSGSVEALDPDYAKGLRAALGAALEHGIAAIKGGLERSSPPPPELLAQARLAAQSGVSLDTVLRRYVAGQALFVDALVEEAEASGLGPGALKGLLQAQAALLDRILAAISEEHTRESQGRLSFAEQRAAEQVERLLGGESIDTASLAYDFAGHHLAVIAKGPGAGEAIQRLAAGVDRRLLLVQREDGVLWAWLGGRREIDPLELSHLDAAALPKQVSLVFGEPARGLDGWRFTHRQARAALPIALRSPKRLIRYAEVALLAATLQDELLSTSLRELYLLPLKRERDGGKVARETLRAYFATERNVSSAAAILGVSRRTVANRLHTIEKHLGCPLSACAAEVEAALRLHEVDQPSSWPDETS